VAGPEQAVLVLGPPRSGKTSCVVVPNVLAAPGPVVSTSTKPEVMQATLAARRRLGRCWLYDPSGTVPLGEGCERLRWSPISSARGWDDAVLTARAMVGAARPGVARSAAFLSEASHWIERAEALLAPMLHAAALEGRSTEELMRWVHRRDGTEARDILEGAGAPAQIAADLLIGILATDDRELSGIWSTAGGVLAAYRSRAALAGSVQPNFDPDGFVRGADTVYVCATGRHQAMVGPLVVGLVEDVRGACYARAARERAAGAPVVLALDEVANIAPIPELPALVSEGGGQGLLTLACVQDLSQARARWGQAAEGFGSLFGATVVLPGIGDVRTLDAISRLCGDVEVTVRSETQGRGGSSRHHAVSWSTRRQRLVPVEVIAQGHAGRALVVGGGRPPGWPRLTPWWLCSPWKELAGVSPLLARAPTARGAGRAMARIL